MDFMDFLVFFLKKFAFNLYNPCFFVTLSQNSQINIDYEEDYCCFRGFFGTLCMW